MLDLFTRCAGYGPDIFRPRRIGVAVSVPAYRPLVRGPAETRNCMEGSAALSALR